MLSCGVCLFPDFIPTFSKSSQTDLLVKFGQLSVQFQVQQYINVKSEILNPIWFRFMTMLPSYGQLISCWEKFAHWQNARKFCHCVPNALCPLNNNNCQKLWKQGYFFRNQKQQELTAFNSFRVFKRLSVSAQIFQGLLGSASRMKRWTLEVRFAGEGRKWKKKGRIKAVQKFFKPSVNRLLLSFASLLFLIFCCTESELLLHFILSPWKVIQQKSATNASKFGIFKLAYDE